MLIFTESKSADYRAKAEAEPEHKKKDVKKAMMVKSDKDELADDAVVQQNIGKF